MKSPTEILKAEHQNILKVIGAIQKECELINTGAYTDKDFFNRSVDFIRNYADRFHHAKEEDILFSELSADGINIPAGPVQQMLREHDMGREYIDGLVEGMEVDDKEKITYNALGYCQLLKQHIFKEDNILYPMAEQALDEQIQARMLKEFVKTENEKFQKDQISSYRQFASECDNRHK